MIEPTRPLHVVAYGGGVNSVAVLLRLMDLGIVPRAIVMADPGDEHQETYDYRDTIVIPFLAKCGYPTIETISRKSEALYRPRAKNTKQSTLREECIRTHSLPSIAYGWKKCSQKYKIEVQNWYYDRQPWAHAEWDAGNQIVKVIGYDADEPNRALPTFANDMEHARFRPYYPLLDAHMGRDECERFIAAHGLPVPHKSACWFCPSNQLDEWRELKARHPEQYAAACEMEANAHITTPDVVGLLRAAPHGKRQLRLWDGSNPGVNPAQLLLPCECSL